MDLDQIRTQLTVLDQQLLELVAERQRLSHEVARAKRAMGKATRDFQREREVILRARAQAEQLEVSPGLAEKMLRLLIQSSLATQERARVGAQGQGSGQRALVIGGAGKMGRWFADFLANQGYRVEVADPTTGETGYPQYFDWREAGLDQDIIVVATPLGTTADLLLELAEVKPAGLVFDIGSLKTPLRAGIAAMVKAGIRVASVHPMFGPDTDLLSGRHVIHVDVGRADALAEVQALFAATMVEQVTTGLDEHDRLIAFVLGLSHAISIAFFTALANSGEAAPRLAGLSSTTFDAQLAVSSLVAHESPALYFEIQSLNEYGQESLAALGSAVEQLRTLVARGDGAGFEALMQRGRSYLDDRAARRPG